MRSLPKRQNPLVLPGECPPYEELLNRRRLGKTKLSVKPGQVGSSNATKPENLGTFEYAHLRAPLPEDLKGSEIFASHQNQSHPETYFLMRRSKDGFISATGMFKIAFPWATHAEEKAERDWLKEKEGTSHDEVAGNVWIAPELAVDLAREYGLSDWIRALLDPSDIIQSPAAARKQIAAPPKFDMDKVKLPPAPGKTPKGRAMRSVSPSKASSPAKSKASPRKRQTKAMKEANLAHAEAASASLQSALEDAAAVPLPAETPDEKIRVEVDSAVDLNGDTETTLTTVMVEMPAGSPDLSMPEDTEKMLEMAKKMVEEAKELESSPKASRKRKAEDIEPDDIDAEMPVQPAKKARVLEEKLKREKVRTRALVGVAATLTIAAAIPYFF